MVSHELSISGCHCIAESNLLIIVLLRYPLPQHYSVTMEIAKDRTTQATVETCTSDTFDKNQCPRHVTVGQDFVRRSLNEPCQKMVSTQYTTTTTTTRLTT